MPVVALTCPTCGGVSVPASQTEVHANRRDGFRLLTATCPGCGETIASRDGCLVAAALAGGARTWELRAPMPAMTADDLLDLHLLLADEQWCARFTAGAD